STSWGTGLEQQAQGWVTFDLGPTWLSPVEQRVTKELLPPGEYAHYALQGLLRGDSSGRATFYRAMRDTGVMSANDIRALEELPPIPGPEGDTYLQPTYMAPLGSNPLADDDGDLPARAAALMAEARRLLALHAEGGDDARDTDKHRGAAPPSPGRRRCGDPGRGRGRPLRRVRLRVQQPDRDREPAALGVLRGDRAGRLLEDPRRGRRADAHRPRLLLRGVAHVGRHARPLRGRQGPPRRLRARRGTVVCAGPEGEPAQRQHHRHELWVLRHQGRVELGDARGGRCRPGRGRRAGHPRGAPRGGVRGHLPRLPRD